MVDHHHESINHVMEEWLHMKKARSSVVRSMMRGVCVDVGVTTELAPLMRLGVLEDGGPGGGGGGEGEVVVGNGGGGGERVVVIGGGGGGDRGGGGDGGGGGDKAERKTK
mgnify:CR=1 FL=1